MHNKTSENDRKRSQTQKKHRPTRATRINSACRAEGFGQAAGYTLERSECAPQEKKHTGRQLQPIQPIKPSKNSRTSHTNKQTRRKTLRQHNPPRHKSTLCYKIQTHASHRAKKQKTGFNPNFTRKLAEGEQKTQKNTVFHVKHSIFYLQISPKSIEYYIAKSKNCRKNNT